MQYHLIDLKTVYEAIKRSYSNLDGPPPLPERSDQAYVAYRKAYTPLLKSVGGDRAVYLWFSNTITDGIEYIYVGETHGNEGGLKKRFKDEFRRWHHGFWATTFRSTKYLKEAVSVYSNREKYNPRKSYGGNIENDFLKRGATHIVFCTNLSATVPVKTIQDDLIQLFGNPRGNAKDKRDVPLPDDQLLPISKQIYSEFVRIAQASVPYDP